MCALPADYATNQQGALDWSQLVDTDRTLRDLSSGRNKQGTGEPVLHCPPGEGVVRSTDGFVVFPPRAGESAHAQLQLPQFQFMVSAQALLGGRSPEVALALRAVRAHNSHEGVPSRSCCEHAKGFVDQLVAAC